MLLRMANGVRCAAAAPGTSWPLAQTRHSRAACAPAGVRTAHSRTKPESCTCCADLNFTKRQFRPFRTWVWDRSSELGIPFQISNVLLPAHTQWHRIRRTDSALLPPDPCLVDRSGHGLHKVSYFLVKKFQYHPYLLYQIHVALARKYPWLH